MEKSYWARFYVCDDNQTYSMDVPDLPGCNTCGDSWDEALCRAGEAVRGWLETSLEEGEALPKASSREAITALPADPEMGEARLELISVSPFESGWFQLPDCLMAELAEVAVEEGISINELLIKAAREFLARRCGPQNGY